MNVKCIEVIAIAYIQYFMSLHCRTMGTLAEYDWYLQVKSSLTCEGSTGTLAAVSGRPGSTVGKKDCRKTLKKAVLVLSTYMDFAGCCKLDCKVDGRVGPTRHQLHCRVDRSDVDKRVERHP